MNEEVLVDDLARGCSDFGEHVDKIIEQINLGNVVDEVDSSFVMTALIMGEGSDSDNANRLITSLSIHTPLSREFAQIIDDKTQELAEQAARSYKGEYNV